MCGILLMHGPNARAEVQKRILRMAHRGPDDSDVVTLGDISLGFVRLTINGNSTVGSQPMYHSNLVGAVNGEVYNHEQLAVSNDLFSSECDTDLILPLFERFGPHIIDKLDGFYSGIILDRSSESIWAIRDHIGKKPLLVGKSGEHTFITSELKVLDHIDFFQEVPLGCSRIDIGTGSVKVLSSHSSVMVSDDLVSLFEQAVIKRLPRDGQPLAVFLSGGLDSSLVSSIVSRHRPDAVYFTLGDSKDRDAVEKVIQYLHLSDIREVSLPSVSEISSLISDIVLTTESFNPSIISNGLGTFLLAKAAKEAGIKVVLSGEGADELFGGYHRFENDDSEWRIIRSQLIEDMRRTELRRLDLASMANSIEVRCPFLDHKIRSYSDNLEFDDLYSEGVNKKILRSKFVDYLPTELLNRPKTSLDVGSGIRAMVVNSLRRGEMSERNVLREIWSEQFGFDASHPYFSSYPVFDDAIDCRGDTHR